MTDNNPLVTILMPCYNAMPFLVEALESAISQTYNHLEILCINDGSTDQTGEVLEELAKRDNRVKVIHNEENLKLIRTLNKGIELAQGEYIARMDADDISAQDRIEKQVRFLQKYPDTDIVSTALNIISEQGKQIRKSKHRQHLPLTCLFASFYYMPTGHPDVMGKASIFKENLYMYEEYALHTEDYELWSRLLRKGCRIRNMDDYLLFFRKNSQSISNKYTDIQNTNFIRCAQKHFHEYFQKEVDFHVMHVVANRMPLWPLFRNVCEGFRVIRFIRQEFIRKNKDVIDRPVRREIFVVYHTHIFDVCLQIIKRPGMKSRLYAIFILLTHGYMLFNRKVVGYLGRKVKR